MAEKPRFRLLRRFLGPNWLVNEGESQLVGYALELMRDAFVQRLFLGLLTRFPLTAPGETPPEDALAAMGRDRRTVKGISESNEAYAGRLLRWLDDRKRAGNPFALMQKLAEYTGPLPSFKTVDVRGNWFVRAADGTESVHLAQANWNWDDSLTAGTRWSRFWVVIHANGLWSEGDAWADAGTYWGKPGTSWGSTATADQVSTIRGIVDDWKPAGTRCVNIILAFDPATFSPTAAINSAGLPDGKWDTWSRNIGGVQVPTRLSTARYWDGV